jgi:hypothetical protein
MLIALALMAAGEGVATNPLEWMVGTWCTEPRNGTLTCEIWMPMDKSVMRGEGTTRTERGTTRESMRIQIGETGAVFHAEPQGQAPADFRAVTIDAAARAVTFENAAHDYPQRVRYWRDGELLMAEISLADGSKPQRWRYERAR